MLRLNSKLSKTLCILLLAGLATGAVSAQDELYFQLEPPFPAAGEPFRLVLHGSLLAFFPSDDADDLFAVVDGQTLTVTQRGGLAGIPALNPYVAALDIDGLPLGRYDLVFQVESDGTPLPATFPSPTPGVGTKSLELGQIRIFEPFTVDGPSIADTTDSLRYTVSRIEICSALADTEILPDPDGAGGVIRIRWLVGCPILPEPPSLMSLETEPFGPLSAGTWEVQVVDENHHVLTRRALDVLPNPVFLQSDRFRLDVSWWNNIAADPAFPAARPTDDSALFAFFQRDNWEVMVKVLDGCDINGFYWIFIAANTDQGFDVMVTDTETSAEWTHAHPLGSPAPAVTDTQAIACQ